MKHYHNLLYVSIGIPDEIEGLKQALRLAARNRAPLKAVIVRKRVPQDLGNQAEKYEAAFLEKLQERVREAELAMGLDETSVDVLIELGSGPAPAIRIIQRVMRDGHDLVIREVRKRGDGFKAMDMNLLRKCPCAIWLCRPVSHAQAGRNVAVAIDPENQGEAARALAERLLELSTSLAEALEGNLHIVSCWDHELEDYMRTNVWATISETEISRAVSRERNAHELKLLQVIESSGIHGDYEVHRLQGEASERIPEFVKSHKIDILVMGTIARTGIPGFLIGNTAENIVQEISCSLLALKPRDFTSPVKVS